MDQATLKSNFSYDKNTGIFTRLNRKNSAGSIDHYGYLILKIKGRQYKSHRLAWLYCYGEMPPHNIDHINGIKTDNRITNLRSVPQSENNKNMTVATNNKTNMKGIWVDTTKGLKKKFATKIKGKTYRFYNKYDAKIFRDSLLRGHGYGERHFD